MRLMLGKMVSLLLLFLLASPVWASGKTELTWYGHSAFKIVTPQGHVLLIDPWLVNPSNPAGQADLDTLTQTDLILVSHGHFDHVGQASVIAKKTGARLVATLDMGNALTRYGGFPKEQTGYDTLGNYGGTLSFFDNEVRIAFIPAIHSSSINPKALQVPAGEDQPEFGGNPAGFLIMIQDGPTIYHTGDTDLFSDMALIPRFQAVDVMLTCIGDHFTMGPERAADAVGLVNPGKVIPMHYDMPGVLTGTPHEFQSALKKRNLDNKLLPLAVHKPLYFDSPQVLTSP